MYLDIGALNVVYTILYTFIPTTTILPTAASLEPPQRHFHTESR